MITRATAIKTNTIVHKNYRIQSVLGQGGFGRTYLAKDQKQNNSLCVLKEFSPASNPGNQEILEKAFELFKRETQILARLNHPQIPRFIDQFDENHRIFIVQEYINGKTYFELLKSQGSFTELEILEWLRSLLGVLAYIHSKNILHRDITLDNIIFSDTLSLPVLIDFGVVKETVSQLDNNQKTDLSRPTVVGKVGYAAIEQIRTGQCSPSSDLYSLGVCAIVLLTGKKPDELVDHYSQQWIWPSFVKISSSTEAILRKMTAEKPIDRYQFAHEVIQDLGQKTQVYQLPQPNLKFTEIRQPDLSALNDQNQNQSEKFSNLVGSQTQVSQYSSLHNFASRDGYPFYDENLQEEPEFSREDDSNKSRLQAKKLKLLMLLIAFSFVLLTTTGIILLGINSPYINPICQLLDKCIADKRYEEIYTQIENDFDVLQKTIRDADSLPQLISTSAMIAENIEALRTVPSNAKIYSSVIELLRNYESRAIEINLAIKAFKTIADTQDILKELETKSEQVDSLEALLEILEKSQNVLKQELEPLAEEIVDLGNNTIPTNLLELIDNYQTQIDTLNHRISQEKNIKSLIEDAKNIAALAAEATKQANNTNSLQQYRRARESWRSALGKLEGIPDKTLFAADIGQLRSTYQAQIRQLSGKISSIEAQRGQSTWLSRDNYRGNEYRGNEPNPPSRNPPPPPPPNNAGEPLWPGESEPLW